MSRWTFPSRKADFRLYDIKKEDIFYIETQEIYSFLCFHFILAKCINVSFIDSKTDYHQRQCLFCSKPENTEVNVGEQVVSKQISCAEALVEND